MENNKMIKKLNDIKESAIGNTFLVNQVETLINELKQEEYLKGYKGSEKERVKLALSIQKDMMKRCRRPILALWHKNATDNLYYWTNSAIMVRLNEQDFIHELKTTKDTIRLVDKKGGVYYEWHEGKCDYPNVDNIFLKHGNKATINVADFMAFLKANKSEDEARLQIGDTTIFFNPMLVYNALVLSKIAQQETTTLTYLGELKPFMFNDNALCTPLKIYKYSWESEDEYALRTAKYPRYKVK